MDFLSPEFLAKGLDLLAHASVILGALLSVLGGLKVLARYTNTEADDKALAAVESVILKIRDLVAKVLPFIKKG